MRRSPSAAPISLRPTSGACTLQRVEITRTSARGRLRGNGPSIRLSAGRWLVGVLVMVLSALVIGVPTGVIETDLYTRMTPVLWWNYPVWALSSVLAGLIAATYVGPRGGASKPDRSARTAGATLLSVFAVGCPVCNKLVIALLGVSGALNLWAPLQPLLGVLSVSVLVAALTVRLRRPNGACRVPSQR